MPRWITALTTVPGTDIVLSGSWDGWIRAWKISEDKRVILPLGTVGGGASSEPDTPSFQLKQNLALDITTDDDNMAIDNFPVSQSSVAKEAEPLIKGVINGIAVFERRNDTARPDQPLESRSKSKSKEPETRGLCIVAAVGKEHRLGRWKCYVKSSSDGPTPEGRNGAVVFEVSFASDQTKKVSS